MTFQVIGVTVVKPITGTTVAEFDVHVTGIDLENEATVHYQSAQGTAITGLDYQQDVSGTLTVLPEQQPGDFLIPVTILGNTLARGPVTFTLTLSDPVNAGIGPGGGVAIGTVLNNPGTLAGSVQFAATAIETPGSGPFASVTVTRTGGAASGVGVSYATIAGGTAVPGVDYTPTAGVLTFGYQQTTATFTIPILGDLLIDTPRTFVVALASPTGGATLGTPTREAVTIVGPSPLIVTNTNDSGLGSLRQAILAANAIAGPNLITFAIPGATVGSPAIITPASPLPAITGPTAIDGRTEPGYAGSPLVVVSGLGVVGGGDGLRVLAGPSAILGLAIGGFSGSGVVLQADGSVVQADRIGTDASGKVGLADGRAGVLISGGSYDVVGGPVPGEGDLLSGNAGFGVEVDGAGSVGDLIQGDLIGTDSTGTRALPNAAGGVFINAARATTVGGPGNGRDLISGNGGPGISIAGTSATGNVVQNDWVGIDATGSIALANLADGILLASAPANLIGGPSLGQGNVISGNAFLGIEAEGPATLGDLIEGDLIGTDATGRKSVGNQLGGVFLNQAVATTVGSPGAGRNLISGNLGYGLAIAGASARGNAVQGDLIGTDVTGASPLANSGDGIVIAGAPSNLIGGPTLGQGDVVSGNAAVGVEVDGASAAGNLVQGDLVGTDIAGSRPVGNGLGGIFLSGATMTLVGGIGSARDVLSGNGGTGLSIAGNAFGNVVQGDLIGTDATGSTALANAGDGVLISSAPSNMIGGEGSGEGNLVSGNSASGIEVAGPATAGNLIRGDLVGTDITGLKPIGNSLGGVFLNNSAGTVVGGLGRRLDLISGNGGAGIVISGSGASGNAVEGDLIGLGVDGVSPLGNADDGVYLEGAPGNVIGGVAGMTGNVISANRLVGVRIAGAGSVGDVVVGNRIGTDPTGTRPLGNASDGVFVSDAPEARIGDGTVAGRNLISANGASGVQAVGPGSAGLILLGNLIGTDISGGLPLGNRDDGVFLDQAPSVTIGGVAAGLGNVISANGGVGLQLTGTGTAGAIVVGNLIGATSPGATTLGNAYGVFLDGTTAPALGTNRISGNKVGQVATN